MKKPKRNRARKRRWDERDQDTLAYESRSRREDDPNDAPSVDLEGCFRDDIEPNGLVISPYGLLAFVEWNNEEVLCRVADPLTDGKRSVLAPGDRVLVEDGPEQPVVTAVKTRRCKLSRPAIGGSREKMIAANIDTAVIVASVAQPAFRPGLVDRFLIAAQIGGVEPVLCLNKLDLVEEPPPEVETYRETGVTVVCTSCETGEGIDELHELLKGKLAVLAGHSGVGKSSLLNKLEPDLDLATREVSQQTGKGQHTTTSSRLYRLSGDARIIDTPGIKQLGLWQVSPEEVAYYFPEMAEAPCKFRDCTHTHEPGCAVREQVESGAIAKGRYDSYIRIREALEEEKKLRPYG